MTQKERKIQINYKQKVATMSHLKEIFFSCQTYMQLLNNIVESCDFLWLVLAASAVNASLDHRQAQKQYFWKLHCSVP